VVDALSGVQFSLTAQGEEHRLEEVVERYVEQNPDATVLDELRFRQAEGAFQSGNLRASITDFEDFLRTANDEALIAAANLYVGRAYVDLGQPRDAEAYFRRVVERYPNASVRPEAAARLGALYLDAERYDDALALFRSLGAEAATPELGAEARLGEAEALLGLGRIADAEALFGAVIEAVPGTALADRAGLGLARAFEAQGEADEAVAFYRELGASSDEAAGAEAMVRLAEALFAQGDYQAVLTLADDLDVEDRFAGYPDRVAAVLLARARSFRRLGEPGRADEAYGRVIAAYPETPAAAEAQRER
jgi:TolA-binding protein